jgi:TetR/AcrR family transcriptional regulator, transcriptional repressor of bet genes
MIDAMPRQVDHDERRRQIVEALLRIAGTHGLDAVSLREVAQEAGISMGAVQYYFATKDEMLAYALRHWLDLSVHKGFSARVGARLAGGTTTPAAVLSALAAEYLPYDDASRFDARIGIAFLARAAVNADLAQDLRPAFTGFVATLRAVLADAGVGRPSEAQRLAALLDGLRQPVLLGTLDRDEALTLVRRHLDDVLH